MGAEFRFQPSVDVDVFFCVTSVEVSGYVTHDGLKISYIQ